MICQNCGKEVFHWKRSESNKNGYCRYCGDLQVRSLPDAYVSPGGYFDENLADDKHPQGQWITDKNQKKEIMRNLDVIECGDRIHGARNFEGDHYGERKRYR